MRCRSCQGDCQEVLDLGEQPASNALLKTADAHEETYPLRVAVCTTCWLLQTTFDVDEKRLFSDEYPYFSGQSKQWVAHCNEFAEAAIKRFGLNTGMANPPQILPYAGYGGGSCVIEVGGNDGTSLIPFKGRVASVWNIEPSKSVAAASEAAGIPVLPYFFGVPQGQQLQADLLIANNVMAHTPNINAFVKAIHATLKPHGTAAIEFPWALNLIEGVQFDTIYHEHYSYLSLRALEPLFARHGLKIYDVQELPTHGGSLRIFAHRTDVACPRVTSAVFEARRREIPLTVPETYERFARRARGIREQFWDFLGGHQHEVIAGYGAAAKGNTFLNFCQLTRRDIPFVADTTPAKIFKFLPGSRIQIVSEKMLLEERPKYVLILPWNWRDEIVEKLGVIRSWGGRFVTAIPELKIT